MNEQDIVKFSEMLAGLGELYSKEITDTLEELYWRSLEKYEFLDVSRAVSSYVVNPDNGQFFPKPADLVRFIDGDNTTQAQHALTKLDQAIRQVGPYMSVCFDDPITQRIIVDMGGWFSFSEITDDDWKFKQHEFVQRYRGYLNKPPENYPKKLTGMIEAENNMKGLKEKVNVVMLGNAEKAMLVYQKGKDRIALPVMSIDEVQKKLASGEEPTNEQKREAVTKAIVEMRKKS